MSKDQIKSIETKITKKQVEAVLATGVTHAKFKNNGVNKRLMKNQKKIERANALRRQALDRKMKEEERRRQANKSIDWTGLQAKLANALSQTSSIPVEVSSIDEPIHISDGSTRGVYPVLSTGTTEPLKHAGEEAIIIPDADEAFAELGVSKTLLESKLGLSEGFLSLDDANFPPSSVKLLRDSELFSKGSDIEPSTSAMLSAKHLSANAGPSTLAMNVPEIVKGLGGDFAGHTLHEDGSMTEHTYDAQGDCINREMFPEEIAEYKNSLLSTELTLSTEELNTVSASFLKELEVKPYQHQLTTPQGQLIVVTDQTGKTLHPAPEVAADDVSFSLKP